MRAVLQQTGGEHPDTPPQEPYETITEPIWVVYEDGQPCCRTVSTGDLWNYVDVALKDRKEHYIDVRLEQDRRSEPR